MKKTKYEEIPWMVTLHFAEVSRQETPVGFRVVNIIMVAASCVKSKIDYIPHKLLNRHKFNEFGTILLGCPQAA